MSNRPSQSQSQQATSEQAALIEKILQEPLLLRRLCDRVYRLMLEDAQLQRNRFVRF